MINDYLKLVSDDKNLLLESKRLKLEPTIENHADHMVSLLQEISLYTFIPQNPPSLENLKKLYSVWSSRKSPDGTEIWLNWVAILKQSGEYIGQFQVGYSDKIGFSIAYTVGKSSQRRGFATEGLIEIIKFLETKMSANSIKAWVDTRNIPSIEMIKKLRFKQVQFIKDADEFKGTKSDEFVFEIKKK